MLLRGRKLAAALRAFWWLWLLCHGRGRHHRDRFDFDQGTGPGEGGDCDRRARGRRGGIDEAVPYLPELPDMGDVDEVVVELDDVLEAGADGGQRVLEVDEGLFRLGAKIAGCADE